MTCLRSHEAMRPSKWLVRLRWLTHWTIHKPLVRSRVINHAHDRQYPHLYAIPLFNTLLVEVNPLVLQRLLLQLLPGLPLAHLLGELELLVGLDDHLLNETGSDLVLDHLTDLVVLHNLLSVSSQVLDGLSVDRVLGVLVLQLLEGGLVQGNQCRSGVGMLVDTGQTDRSFVSGIDKTFVSCRGDIRRSCVVHSQV
ncbi:uncharacterized protein YALI1_E27218g [Yarrowia lipolytica]|uniref:Uncharacterized protein n=1 Tax=Yarrowia lipolytica TaxID=4952 RepID=A0A1D8NJM1_YARLL|nr:hypothetical protein YALI1_E27218g [Yarrowia lipolytica]